MTEECRVIVAGSRDFNNYDLLENTLNNNLKSLYDIVIVSGEARGADKLGERYAEEYKLKCKRFPANWDLLGKGAGYIRNEDMAKYASEGKQGMLFAFWDGKSKGTAHMINTAKRYGLTVKVIMSEDGKTNES